jgi:cellobiose epimerase
MVTKEMLRGYSREADREARENILPFWLKLMDHIYGGFYGEVSFSGEIQKEAIKGGVLCARLVWTFAHAYLVYHDPTYIDAARHAYRFLMDNFWDREHGGTFWSVDFQGKPADTRKMVLPQSFTIYALAEYYRATQEPEALEKAIELFGLIELHSHDVQFGGYREGFDRIWTQTGWNVDTAKAMDPHLRVMMAYTNLLRVWNSPLLMQRLTECVEIFLDHLIDPQGPHLILFTREDWQATNEDFSYGHDIELVWLLPAAVDVLGDTALRDRSLPVMLRMAEEVYRAGLDDDGAVFDKAGPQGLLDQNKNWWPQAESVVGFLNAYQMSGDEKFYRASRKNWKWIQSNLVNREHGDWYAQLTRDRKPVAGRNLVDSWKCPYHNSRCCFEVQERIEKLLETGL